MNTPEIIVLIATIIAVAIALTPYVARTLWFRANRRGYNEWRDYATGKANQYPWNPYSISYFQRAYGLGRNHAQVTYTRSGVI